jgi:hypothetical protein
LEGVGVVDEVGEGRRQKRRMRRRRTVTLI